MRSVHQEAKETLRRRIVEAADRVIRERGLPGATTREIAREAGCSEGSIYVHFEDKVDLLVAVVVEREPTYARLLELPTRAGSAAETVETVLAEWIEHLLVLLRENLPVFLAVLGDRELFDRFKARLREQRTGLVAVVEAVGGYVEAEKAEGRIRADVDPAVVSAVLVGASRDYVLARLLHDSTPVAPEAFARQLARLAVTGLAPASEPRPDLRETEGGTL